MKRHRRSLPLLLAVLGISERFVLRRPSPNPPAVTVIANWTEELEIESR